MEELADIYYFNLRPFLQWEDIFTLRLTSKLFYAILEDCIRVLVQGTYLFKIVAFNQYTQFLHFGNIYNETMNTLHVETGIPLFLRFNLIKDAKFYYLLECYIMFDTKKLDLLKGSTIECRKAMIRDIRYHGNLVMAAYSYNRDFFYQMLFPPLTTRKEIINNKLLINGIVRTDNVRVFRMLTGFPTFFNIVADDKALGIVMQSIAAYNCRNIFVHLLCDFPEITGKRIHEVYPRFAEEILRNRDMGIIEISIQYNVFPDLFNIYMQKVFFTNCYKHENLFTLLFDAYDVSDAAMRKMLHCMHISGHNGIKNILRKRLNKNS